METFTLTAKELILKEKKAQGGTETFVYEPATVEEERLGNLYIIGWTQKNESDLEFVPNLIASAIKREFYTTNGENAEIRLEASLKKANEMLEDLGGGTKDITQKIGFCVVNIVEETLRCAFLGSPAALLFRGGIISDINKHQPQKNRKKFFSALISGTLEDRDAIIFGTGDILAFFSDAGIKKLFTIPLEERADVISSMYEKRKAAGVIPEQALILLDVGTHRQTKKIDSRERDSAVKLAGAVGGSGLGKPTKTIVTTLQASKKTLKKISKRRMLFLALGTLGLIGFAWIFVFVTSAARAIALLEKNIRQAQELRGQDNAKASALIRDTETALLVSAFPFYHAHAVVAIAERVNHEKLAQSGMYTAQRLVAPLAISALDFEPRFIFDADVMLYVFGETPDVLYKIDKKTGQGSFTVMRNSPVNFEIQRMIEQDGYFYAIDDTAKTAHLFDLTENKLIPVVKTLKKILAIKQSPGTHGAFTLKRGQEIEHAPANNPKEYFILNARHPVIDFAPARDGSGVYLLTDNAVSYIDRT